MRFNRVTIDILIPCFLALVWIIFFWKYSDVLRIREAEIIRAASVMPKNIAKEYLKEAETRGQLWTQKWIWCSRLNYWWFRLVIYELTLCIQNMIFLLQFYLQDSWNKETKQPGRILQWSCWKFGGLKNVCLIVLKSGQISILKKEAWLLLCFFFKKQNVSIEKHIFSIHQFF